jgi:hypothetical protein
VTAEADLYLLERRILTEGAAGDWLDVVETWRKVIAMGNGETLRAAIGLVEPPLIEGVALAGVSTAFGLGRDDALSVIDAGKKIVKAVSKSLPSAATRDILRGVDRDGQVAADRAAKLAASGAEPETFMAPLFGHANSIQGRVTEAINRAGNEGTARVAKVADLPLVWVAETNACVHCLAYSGLVADPGTVFPGGLTYGKKSYHPQALAHPPLHPNCRCTVEPLNDQSYADALRREADRSVLRGFSLESESMGVRVDAARRLLDSGVNAPKSVLAYARAAVKRGSFTTRDR